MNFIVSKGELNRRKKAFTVLLFSLLTGIVLFSNVLVFPIFMIGYISIIIVFFILCVITFQFLNSLSRMEIRITDQEIERVTDNLTEKYLLLEIESLKIKRRTNGVIRELYIVFRNNRRLYISAFEDDFENLKNMITGKLNQNAKVKEIREPLDFDHVLFYPILGLSISFISIFSFKQILALDYSGVRILILFVFVYIFSLAIYFIIKKPISTRSGKNQTIVDYIAGAIMIIISLWILIIGLGFLY